MISILYIIAISIIAIFITISTEVEWFGWTTLTLIGTIAAIQCFHLFDIWLYLKTHIVQDVIYTIAYIAIGVIWSFAKWFFFLINERDKTREFIKNRITSSFSYNPPVINIPQAANNKGKIIAWISYWPFSAIGTILNDPFRKLFNLIFSQFKNLYQKIANSIFKNDIYLLEQEIAIKISEEYKNK